MKDILKQFLKEAVRDDEEYPAYWDGEKEDKWDWVKKSFPDAYEESPLVKYGDEGDFETSDGAVGKDSVLMWISDVPTDPLYWTGSEWLDTHELDPEAHPAAYAAAWDE